MRRKQPLCRVCLGRQFGNSDNHVRVLEAGLEPKETGVQEGAKETEDVYFYQVAHG